MKYELFYKYVVPMIEHEDSQMINIHIKKLIDLFYNKIGDGMGEKNAADEVIEYYKNIIEGVKIWIDF